MRRIKGKKRLIAGLSALVIIGTLGVGGTYSWNQHEAEVENVLQSRNAGVNIVEEFPDSTVTAGVTKEKKVHVKNTGTAAVFLRVAWSERWETEEEILITQELPDKNWTSSWGEDWVKGNDGWYYYEKILPAGGTTEDFLESVTFPAACQAGASYQLEFLAEIVQASDEEAVNTAATQEIFGWPGKITNMTTQKGAVTGGTVNWG